MVDPTDRDDGGTGPVPADAGTVARSLVVRGLVQGVFFRASTEAVAARHGVAGWAANRDDGTVELWLEGPERAVAEVEAWVRDGGPSGASVDDVEVEDRPAAGRIGFEVR